jgi:hypothetical protein
MLMPPSLQKSRKYTRSSLCLNDTPLMTMSSDRTTGNTYDCMPISLFPSTSEGNAWLLACAATLGMPLLLLLLLLLLSLLRWAETAATTKWSERSKSNAPRMPQAIRMQF